MIASLAAAWIWASASAHPAPARLASGTETRPPSPIPVSPLFTPQVLHWEHDIRRWAAAGGLDPNLVAVVIQIESCGDPGAVSSSGALGLFQVMPFHFGEEDEPLDVETN
ncbi:MAG: transglycosylase SLT domain-containing protein, partial [Anaerolineales bacterium]